MRAQRASKPPDDLVAAVRSALRAAADPSLAPGQQAYMKSAMPFLGVRVPAVRRLVRAEARTRRIDDPQVLAEAAATLWNEATHREERYAATALLGLHPDWARTFVDTHDLSPPQSARGPQESRGSSLNPGVCGDHSPPLLSL